uniref:Uncharacterized protein n=1 Tax=Zea mays TaxID=4577 RepID=C0PM16_MAIZE|nr:unknown [Zea mays]
MLTLLSPSRSRYPLIGNWKFHCTPWIPWRAMAFPPPNSGVVSSAAPPPPRPFTRTCSLDMCAAASDTRSVYVPSATTRYSLNRISRVVGAYRPSPTFLVTCAKNQSFQGSLRPTVKTGSPSGYSSAYLAHRPYCLYLSLCRKSLLANRGSTSGTKNSAAFRSGTPISHNVGPDLGGRNTRSPRSTTAPPTATVTGEACTYSPRTPGTHA